MSAATYKRLAATTTRLLTKYGSELQFRAKGSSSDPVTGSGGSEGETRPVVGVLTKVEEGYFSESLRKSGDRMLVLVPTADVKVGEKWVDGSSEWPIIELKTIKPDNSNVIAYRALVRG